MKNYRVQVETYDGCVTIWYEKSKAKFTDPKLNIVQLNSNIFDL